MIRQKPDLELLLDTPLPGMKTQKEVTAEVYQKQAQAMFHRYDTLDWEDVRLLASDLKELLNIGNEFLKEKQLARAMPVFLGMFHCFGEYLHHWDDLTEPLFDLRGECIKALLSSLPLLSETDPLRETILLPLVPFGSIHQTCGFLVSQLFLLGVIKRLCMPRPYQTKA